MRTVTILGATGSVGQSAADVLAAHPDVYRVLCVTAHKNVAGLVACAKRLQAKRAVIADASQYGALKTALAGTAIEAAAGEIAMMEAAQSDADITLVAVVGIVGLPYVMAALRKNKIVAIANKEPLVAAGKLVMAAAADVGATILPVDSEHNAVFQLFENHNRGAVERVTLTASGGPFRTWDHLRIQTARVEDALKHPNWSMGRKITIDSATLMNKGLEMIEAKVLFSLRPDQVDAIIHPQSLVHAFVAYHDGSVLAQMGAPDMRTPLTYIFGWPDRLLTPGARLDVRTLQNLQFEPVDTEKFPCFTLARQVLAQGMGEAITLNAANEVAVDSFLAGQINFGAIAGVVDQALQRPSAENILNIDDVLACDRAVRETVKSYILKQAA